MSATTRLVLILVHVPAEWSWILGREAAKVILMPSSGNGIFEIVLGVPQKVDCLFYIGCCREVLEVKLYRVSLRQSNVYLTL